MPRITSEFGEAILKRLRWFVKLRSNRKLAMILSLFFKIWSVVLGSVWSYLDDYLVSPLAKPAFILGLIYAVINWKVVPFAWHMRVFNGYYLHYVPNSHLPPLPPVTSARLLSPSSSSFKSGGSTTTSTTTTTQKPTIFLPTLYKTSVPPGEIDFSFHKSNSTYVTDLDIARGYHLYTVFRRGFYLWSQGRKPDTQPGTSSGGGSGSGSTAFPMLGGTTCTFKKEIPPLAKVEIWTRVLSWDEKWIYLISHFVKPGAAAAAAPGAIVRGQGGRTKVGLDDPQEKNSDDGGEEIVLSPAVYATCVSKVVLKEGRKTIPPEEFFRLCGLMGEREAKGPPPIDSLRTERGKDESKSEKSSSESEWNWQEIHAIIEARRVEGMKLAGHVASLDEGHGLFGKDFY